MVAPSAYTLVPDLLIERRGRPPVVVDTKWKHVDAGTRPSSADAYQMLAYAHAYGARDCVLLYPTIEPHATLALEGRELHGAFGGAPWTLHRKGIAMEDYMVIDQSLRDTLGDLL